MDDWSDEEIEKRYKVIKEKYIEHVSVVAPLLQKLNNLEIELSAIIKILQSRGIKKDE